jgi:hypothetical protein
LRQAGSWSLTLPLFSFQRTGAPSAGEPRFYGPETGSSTPLGPSKEPREQPGALPALARRPAPTARVVTQGADATPVSRRAPGTSPPFPGRRELSTLQPPGGSVNSRRDRGGRRRNVPCPNAFAPTGAGGGVCKEPRRGPRRPSGRPRHRVVSGGEPAECREAGRPCQPGRPSPAALAVAQGLKPAWRRAYSGPAGRCRPAVAGGAPGLPPARGRTTAGGRYFSPRRGSRRAVSAPPRARPR